jgi:3-oxoacyl-(acyl-carrier-protein) synthase
MTSRRVVITGMGVLAPNGHGLDTFEQALRRGESGIRFQPQLKELNFASQVAGIPENIDRLAEEYFDSVSLHGMDRYAVIGCIAALDAWRDAGLSTNFSETVDWDTAISFGSAVGSIETIGHIVVPQVDSGQVRRLGSSIPERIMESSAGARLGGMLGIGGPVLTSSNACCTGADVIAYGYWMIKEGRATRVLAGASEADSAYGWSGFDSLRVLSRNFNEAPERASRPLSASAGGFVASAGAASLVLETLESAMARGARIYAEIIGAAVNSGGQRNGGSMTKGNPEGVQRCMRDAIQSSGIRPEQIDLISGHLTGTMGDPIELSNWRSVLDLPADRFPIVNAPKSLIGHALGAAGAIESVACVLQLHKGFVHPSINCEDVHPQAEWCAHSIARTCMEKRPQVIVKSSFGFGDVNSCLLFKEFH